MEDGHKDKGRMSVESDHIEDIDLMLPNSPGSVGLGSENSSPEKPKPNRRVSFDSSPPSSPISVNGEENRELAPNNDQVPQRIENGAADYSQFRGRHLANGKKSIIWGTSIDVDQVREVFTSFVKEFPNPMGDVDDSGVTLPLYDTILDQMIITEETSLNLNSEYLESFNSTLYKQLVSYPTEVISLMDVIINELFSEKLRQRSLDAEDVVHVPIQVRPFNLKTIKPMRDLDPEDIDKLITIRGMITRTSSVIPDLKKAHYTCLTCQHFVVVESTKDGTFTEPRECTHCKGKLCMSLVHNKCDFADKQWIKLQETQDAIPEGETPHTVSLFAYDDLVDVARPGDKIEVTGIFRANAIKNMSRQRSLRSIYKTYVDVLHFKKTQTHRLQLEDPRAEADSEYYTSFNERDVPDSVVDEKEQKLIQLSKSPDIYEKLTRSVAPSIWELDDVKKGVLCQLFGGANKEFKETGIGRFRGDINILLCGDPGTSKSQLLQYVHKIAPRGIYTSGKGSSAVGLTAYVTRDPETGEAVLESGALVLSDRGICCIDEFDKMTDQTRSILHEAMEQQTVSIAKAGIICTLNARTSILASANPMESRYNPRLSVVDNIQLPPTLLSRFDLIYLVLDKPEERTDRRLAAHLVSLYTKNPDHIREEILDMQTLTSYISYAKKKIHPKISDESVNVLVQGYLDMRKLGSNKKTITATPRQLESLIRLAEAHARIRYSEVVERIDVAEAIRLVRSATQQAAMDPTTGTIDMDLITTGRSTTSRARMGDLVRELRGLLSAHITSWRFDQLLKKMSEQSYVDITPNELREALKQLQEVDFVVLSGGDRNPVINVMAA